MPSIPSYNKCSELGCNNPKTLFNSFCLDHGGRDKPKYYYNNSEQNKLKKKQYNASRWARLRQRQLSTQPLCQACLQSGHLRTATDVDHVFPWNAIGKEAFMLNLFQSLCHACHSVKTHLEQQGICRHYERPDAFKDYSHADWQGAIQRQNDEKTSENGEKLKVF